ncbi:hypothetical protein B566_EDAN018658 [Ephemera danica]|nr:hypothetical protein B566_EDAN018658 [Ephemera danica]
MDISNLEFSKADPSNLPSVTTEAMYIFLSENELFISSESRGEKHARSSRENYGDSAIGAVQVGRNSNTCIVRAKICPEHNIIKTNYTVEAIIEENESGSVVLSVKCLGCIARAGGCKHSLAFLFWLNRRTEEPATTSKKCYWKKGSLTQAGKDARKISDLSKRKKAAEPTSIDDTAHLTPAQQVFNEFLFIATSTLVERVLGARFEPTEAMARGLRLESEVLQIVAKERKSKIITSGYVLSGKYPMFGSSPDGVDTESVYEVKCPTKAKTQKYYVSEDGIITEKVNAQLQLSMLLTNKTKGYDDWESSESGAHDTSLFSGATVGDEDTVDCDELSSLIFCRFLIGGIEIEREGVLVATKRELQGRTICMDDTYELLGVSIQVPDIAYLLVQSPENGGQLFEV